MRRTTFADAKASRIAESINIKPTDTRFAQYINEATARLLVKGKWWDTFARYSVAVTSQLFSLPPEVDTIEKVAVGRWPLPLRTEWFAFMDNGWGLRDDTIPNGSGVPEVLYRGMFPVVNDIVTPGVLTLKCDVALDVGKSVLVLGLDQNGNWIRTLTAGVWSDGESVLLAQGAGTNTVHQFSRVTNVQPPSTLSGQWWLYSGSLLLGNYQYWETNPMYKRFLFPFISSAISTVEIMGKKAFRPVSKDTDYLVIGNLAALKLACMAAKAEEEHSWGEANLLWHGGKNSDGEMVMGAVSELDNELNHHLGDGFESGITVRSSNIGMADPVESLL